ncbi:MAG: YraN family protein [Chitinophagales bacterium]
MAKNHDLGKRGEQMAAKHLFSKGYEILETSWRYSRCEVDIICKDGENDITIFVEVKTRSSDYFGYPEEFVSLAQQKRLAKAAEAYMYENELDGEMRFDIVAISVSPQKTELKHIEDAFFFYDS